MPAFLLVGFQELGMPDVYKRQDIRFGYDTRYEELKKAFSDSDFSEDFSKYPRAEKFIPDWLADILQRKRISF